MVVVTSERALGNGFQYRLVLWGIPSEYGDPSRFAEEERWKYGN